MTFRDDDNFGGLVTQVGVDGDTNPGELYAAIRAAYRRFGGVAPGDNNSNGN